MAEAGLEPARRCRQGILSPQRLPIPPLGQVLYKQGVITMMLQRCILQEVHFKGHFNYYAQCPTT